MRLGTKGGVEVQVIVVDSGSKDGTLDICNSWSVPTIYVPPGNMYRAINAGLQRMDADWLTYLNSDDLVYPSSYDRLIEHGEQQEAAIAYGDCDFIDYEGRFLYLIRAPRPRRVRGLLQHAIIGFAQPAAIFRRSVYEELGGFDDRYRFIADYDFFYRLVDLGYKLVQLKQPAVAAFRVHPAQITSSQATGMKAELATFRDIRKTGSSPRSLVDLLCWRGQNPTYLLKLIRQRIRT